MSLDFTIQREKLDQVVDLLREHNLDMWLTFVRETNMTPDPVLELILGVEMTWISAFIVTPNQDRIAIVGQFDTENVRRMGGWREVIGYDASIFPDLRGVLKRLNPEVIGINYSENDVAADGLSYGMWQLLNRALTDTPYKHRLVSAERVIFSLRSRKSAAEIERIRAAIKTTEAIFEAVRQKLAPGQSALELYDFVRDQMKQRQVTPAWEPCPIVTPGPDAPVGHAAPDEKYKAAAGQLVHMDLGVTQNGYCSDLQRVWYLKKEGEDSVPEPVQKGFEFARNAILAAAKVLKPGVQGWQVDAAARNYFIENGRAEFRHATGHQIGRSVHDGSTVLAPLWERYGNTPRGIVEVDNVFTLELGLQIPEYGFIGLEEDVLVTQDGIEWLSTPQTEVYVVGS
jgi:Xaa-Pro aminopeptidase